MFDCFFSFIVRSRYQCVLAVHESQPPQKGSGSFFLESVVGKLQEVLRESIFDFFSLTDSVLNNHKFSVSKATEQLPSVLCVMCELV